MRAQSALHAVVIAVISALVPTRGKAAVFPGGDEQSCVSYIAQAERHHGVPTGLLGAVALTESGMDGQPYPWALNIAGQAHMADSYTAALRLLRGKDGAPRQDLAVGCMQIHMRYHLAAVQTPEWILWPRNNVWYAASFLRRLFDQYGNWPLAVGHYNASEPVARRTYLCQVTRSLNRLAPQTARAFAFPTDCAVSAGGGGSLRSEVWGHVLVGVAAPTAGTVVLRGGDRQGPKPVVVKPGGGGFCATTSQTSGKMTSQTSGKMTSQTSGHGTIIVRAGRCGASPRSAQRSK